MKDGLLVSAKGINKQFGDYHVLKDVSLSIFKGDIYGFIGKNGAGKTTFMRILCGLMKATRGSIEIVEDTNNEYIEKKVDKFCFLPQNIRLTDDLSTEEIIKFFGKLKDVNCEESFNLAKELDIDIKRKVNNLSPGNQRKVQLIITTMGNPKFLILDEPTAGLDPISVQQVRQIIRKLNEKGCTVFISSHVLSELDNLCNKFAIIDNGRIIFEGQCESVYEIEIGTSGESKNHIFRDIPNIRFNGEASKVYANIHREEVPKLLCKFIESGIDVFSVRTQNIELVYNESIKGGKCYE